MLSESVFVARQPILDRQQRLFAYELLCRASIDAESCLTPHDQASARVITNAVTAIGLDVLTKGHPAFINVTRRLLLDGVVSAIPPECVVVELLEDIEADAEVVAACRELKQAGYAIALDDFLLNERTADLVPLADYIKVDFLASDRPMRDAVARLQTNGRPALLAEKIETAEAFEAAIDEGYAYFQGFFLGRPATKGARSAPAINHAALKLMAAVNDPRLSISQLENLLKHDAALCYRLLRAVNSARFSLRTRVYSVRDALILLGRDTVRHWVSVLVLADLRGQASEEMVTWASVRARFCELTSAHAADRHQFDESFLLGMCSVLDSLLGCSMSDLLAQLPLSDGSKAALLGQDNANRQLLDCIVTYERGEWTRCFALASGLGIDPAVLPQLYAEALRWAHTIDPV